MDTIRRFFAITLLVVISALFVGCTNEEEAKDSFSTNFEKRVISDEVTYDLGFPWAGIKKNSVNEIKSRYTPAWYAKNEPKFYTLLMYLLHGTLQVVRNKIDVVSIPELTTD